MGNTNFSKFTFIKIIIWGAIFFSGLALIYHIRWFIPYLLNDVASVVPFGQTPFIWFIVQIWNNIIFLIIGYLLIKLINKYQQTGYLDTENLRVFDIVIIACGLLAILGALKLAFSHYNDMKLDDVTSISSGINLFIRFITNILTFKEPQTMYFLVATILWAVKQFVIKAILVKSENESFI